MSIVRGQPEAITGEPSARVLEGVNINFEHLFHDAQAMETLLGGALTPSAGAMVYSTSAALALTAVGTTGQLMQSAGTGAPAWTTATYPATVAVNTLLYGSAANAVSALATANSGVLVTSAGGVPSIATDIPTSVTIGSAYIYRGGGTDVAVADGGTNLSVYAVGDLLHATGTTTLAGLADVAVGSVLVSGGVGVVAAWSSTPTIASLTLSTGGALRTGATIGNTLLLQAYDNDTGPGYVTFGTLTAGNTPTFDLSTSVTMGGAGILHE